MKVCWVISESVPGNLEAPIDVATSWGSWKTQESYKTENCICSNLHEASTLTKLGFQNRVTLYINETSYLEGEDFLKIKSEDNLLSLNLLGSGTKESPFILSKLHISKTDIGIQISNIKSHLLIINCYIHDVNQGILIDKF